MSIGSSEFQIQSYMKPNMNLSKTYMNDNNDFIMNDG